MKKIKVLALILSVVFLFSLVACGENPSNNGTVDEKPTHSETIGENFTHSETSVETPCEHKGMGTCTECDANFSSLWKEFVTKNGENDMVDLTDGTYKMTLTFNDDYDCFIFIQEKIKYENLTGFLQNTLVFGYNDYDKKWDWTYMVYNNLLPGIEPLDYSAWGSFTKWSSKSLSIPVEGMDETMKTYAQNGNLLDEIKKYYNILINNTNLKLKECSCTFSMANLGLEQ